MRLFVTVGNSLDPFDRMIALIDDGLARCSFPVEGLCQVGACTRRPRFLPWKLTLPRSEFEQEVAAADVVVCHAGAGSLCSAIAVGHTPITIPRRSRFGEIVNEHQQELVAALRERELVILAEDARDLVNALERFARGGLARGPHRAMPPSKETTQRIRRALEESRPIRRRKVGASIFSVIARLTRLTGDPVSARFDS